MIRRLLAVGAAALGMLVFTSAAGAATLGVTGPPSGSLPSTCGGSPELIGQQKDDPATPYVIPAGGGLISHWQTYTAGATAGSSVTLVVLSNTDSVVTWDTETLPNPLPANNVASFTPVQPLTVSAGDTLALYGNGTFVCYFHGGTVPANDMLFAAAPTVPFNAGEPISSLGSSPGGFTLNVSATLVQNQDAGVQASTFPTATDVASSALLSSTVTNGGPIVGAITFTDQIPSGLHPVSASAGLGTCGISGQTVTCTITGLPVGQSTSVNVVVTLSKPGSYANNVSVSVASGLTDPTSSNNTASATVKVTALPQKCIVPPLRKASVGAAKTLLTELGCRVKIVKKHSKKVGKGQLIGVSGGTRTYAYHHLVSLLVSAGPKG